MLDIIGAMVNSALDINLVSSKYLVISLQWALKKSH